MECVFKPQNLDAESQRKSFSVARGETLKFSHVRQKPLRLQLVIWIKGSYKNKLSIGEATMGLRALPYHPITARKFFVSASLMYPFCSICDILNRSTKSIVLNIDEKNKIAFYFVGDIVEYHIQGYFNTK